MRTSKHIRAEIEQACGFFPSFFEPALPTPQALESLWQQTRTAFLDNPLPALFKERLNIALSRFCVSPQCMICLAFALLPLEIEAGEVMALFKTPLPKNAELEGVFAGLGEAPLTLSNFPAPDSAQEWALIACAKVMFLMQPDAERCRERLARVLGPDVCNSLTLYLAYLKTCQSWIEMHPEISCEADLGAASRLGQLPASESALADLLRSLRETVGVQRFGGEESAQAEQALSAAQAHTTSILESITDAFYALDHEWRFTSVNAQAERLLRRTRSELLGKVVWDEFPEAVDTPVFQKFTRAVAERVPVTVELYYPSLNAWLNVRAYPSSDGLSVFFQNVTERKQAEQERRQQEDLLESDNRNRVMIDAIPHIAWTAGPDGAVDYYNQRWYDYSGLTFETTQAWGWAKVIHPDDVERASGVWQAAIQAGVVSEVEYRLRRKDGAYRLHLGRSVPVRDGDHIIRWVGTATDIEDHRVAEEALRAAQARTSGILESITDAFYALDRDWNFTYVNSEAERLLMRTWGDLIGRNIWEEFPEAIGTKPYLLYRRALADGVPFTFEEFYIPLSTWFEVRVYPSPDGLSIYFQNVTERKRKEEALRESEERYRLLVDGAKDYAMILMDTQGCITGWNTGAERILGWTEAEMLGKPADLIFTLEDREAGVAALELKRAAAEGQAMDLGWHVKKDGTRFFADGIMECLRGSDGNMRGFAKVLRDATEVKQAQDALSTSEEQLRVAKSHLEAVLSAGGVATWNWDIVNDRIFADAEFARLFSLTPEEVAGGPHEVCYRAIHPDDVPRSGATQESLAFQDTYNAQYRVRLPNGSTRWIRTQGKAERNAAGEATSLSGVAIDITENVEREQRVRVLAELAERTRSMTSSMEVIADTVRTVGSFLNVARCVYADIDIDADICTIPTDYCADDSVASMAGAFPISAFGPFLVAEYTAGRTVIVNDVHSDPVRVPADFIAAYDAVACRAFVAVPVLHSDRIVSVIAIHSTTPRHWEPEEVELLKIVVERTWLNVEVTRQERALEREAEELRRAGDRTAAILESISDAFYALDREWRFTFINTEAERLLQRSRVELVGKNFWEEFPQQAGSAFYDLFHRAMEESVPASIEDYYAPLRAWMEVRIYPSADGLSIYFHNIDERKSMEAQRERLAERERNIADHLQAALIPTVPEHIPGMALSKYYEAALEEAGVGGDFYDVFVIDKGCTALVVGDLSGKGLSAASEVATVRNMLRFAVYGSRSLVGAMMSLNSILAEQNLLTGFATLFVGCFDGVSGVLTYVNCGQEPALVRRVSGAIEKLSPTGPILGSFESMAFEERTVALMPGDAVAMFTDGLTEVGRSRQEMIGVEGLTEILSQSVVPRDAGSAATVAEYLTLRIVAGVDAAAQDGVMRDDVCLLVGVVE